MKSWMEYGCTCPNCSKAAEDDYQRGIALWNEGERKIEFENWENECADGCCSSYGMRMVINGVNVGEVCANPLAIVELLCEFLGVDDVKVSYMGNDFDSSYEDE